MTDSRTLDSRTLELVLDAIAEFEFDWYEKHPEGSYTEEHYNEYKAAKFEYVEQYLMDYERAAAERRVQFIEDYNSSYDEY